MSNEAVDRADLAHDAEVSEGVEKTQSGVSLEDEGEIAADYLEELLDIADIDGDIDIDVKNGRAQVAIVSDAETAGLEALAGRNGEVLDALQELTRLTVQTNSGNHSRLMLDIAGYRDRRRTALETIAADAIESLKSGDESVSLDPMNAYERKVVHDAVAAAGYRSESAGQDSGRHVVVYPA